MSEWYVVNDYSATGELTCSGPFFRWADAVNRAKSISACLNPKITVAISSQVNGVEDTGINLENF